MKWVTGLTDLKGLPLYCLCTLLTVRSPVLILVTLLKLQKSSVPISLASQGFGP